MERRVWKAELVHYLRKVGIVLIAGFRTKDEEVWVYDAISEPSKAGFYVVRFR